MEKKIYGYARISRRSQKIERQIVNIEKEYPDAIIYSEAYTGRQVYGRPEFNKLLKKVKSGDTIVFDSVSRMSRNAEDGIELYFDLYNKGISLVFLKEPYINTDIYMDAVKQSLPETGNEIADIYIEATNEVIKILAKKQIEKAFEQAQKEVDDLRERTVEGIREAKRNGKQIGREPGTKNHIKKKEPKKEEIKKYSKDFEGNLNDVEVMKLVELSRNTYYKYKKELFCEKAGIAGNHTGYRCQVE